MKIRNHGPRLIGAGLLLFILMGGLITDRPGLQAQTGNVDLPDAQEDADNFHATDDTLYYRGRKNRSIDILEKLVQEQSFRKGSRRQVSNGIKQPTDKFWLGRIRPIFVKSIQVGDTRRDFISLRNAGLLYTEDGGRNFKRVASLPRRYTAPDYYGPILFRDVLDLWQNPIRSSHLLAVNKHDFLESRDGGRSFKKLPNPGIRTNFSSITARVKTDGSLQDIWLGTTVNGVYRVRLRKGKIRRKAFQRHTRGFPFLRHDSNLYFYEEISGLITDHRSGLLLASTYFHGALYAAKFRKKGRMTFRRFEIPGLSVYAAAQTLYLDTRQDRVFITTDKGVFFTELSGLRSAMGAGGKSARLNWKRTELSSAFPKSNTDSNFAGLFMLGRGKIGAAFARPRASGGKVRRGLYISTTTARRKRKRAMALIRKYKYNTVVIDVKDDFGRLTYGSKLPAAKAMRNTRKIAPIRKLVKDLKRMGVYTIARQVVFKDRRVFAYRKHKYAVIDRRTRAPWIGNADPAHGDDRWVDSYSTWVQNYNIRIAKEVLDMGFDEIQFDYIRFPTDGPVGRIRWRHRHGGSYRTEALESFLRMARANIKKAISVDIYGYNGMYRVAGLTGQDLVDMGDYVNYISPMHYSSHYGPRYLEKLPRNKRTYALLYMGSRRPAVLSRGRFAVRPWLQSFKILIGRWGWGEPYMRAQIQGTLKGGGSGFLWWGPLKLFYLPGRVQKQIFGDSSQAGLQEK